MRYNIVYAIIYGSVLSKYFREDSDVDIAVRFREGPAPIEKISALISPLEDHILREVNIVDILQTSPTLRYTIFTEGLLIFCKNRSLYLEDRALAYSLYMDFRSISDFHFRRIMNAIRRAKK